ncbi:pentatricopeptide repeat-containing protein At2g33680-like isoform X1 [Amborella trichopoda]|nr:pentatricopeptide repeat-containing protein At2g33680-like isoform X1 [Amborella trichopoda]XP_020525241.1 pentatricopeptide repeat-containing protein At2g33680-like isoform X1 [Amborella trichopoda]XP_020525242.1 pentatricopeptide repeat-containing protein At2g33680-like isoform X1 [Amborella trichopoda]XP_020525243.1 pentatricopeptide repeat-containing protein At2g33680-like isoform X1 [Amborella trichopoda]XP_020525244.1 pentatricopeptide repeat-containing protein At2g33680-like isoform X|eukprot:XP_020525240.1 pentatricopeptide repeat-containing protein At2g33680-like isoform X1 [Amborella trichopoda]
MQYAKRFAEFQFSTLPLSITCIVSLLHACSKQKSLHLGKTLHAQFIKNDRILSIHHLYFTNHLINMYAKCGEMERALCLFDRMSFRNTVSWTTLISGYNQQGSHFQALQAFALMHKQLEAGPNHITYASVLSSCTKLGFIGLGMQVHSQSIKQGFHGYNPVANGLISLYMGDYRVSDACRVFAKILEPDDVSWDSFLSGLVQNSCTDNYTLSQLLASRMMSPSIHVTSFTLSSSLRACTEDGLDGRTIHGIAVKTGLDLNPFVVCALISMYSRCKDIEDAFKAFHVIVDKDVASWNALMEGCGENGRGGQGLNVFVCMMESGVKVDEITMTVVVGICSNLAMLEHGRQIHALATKLDLDGRMRMGNSLINMYTKCGNLDESLKVFSEMKERSVVSWTAMIGGLAHHGHATEALALFYEMQKSGLDPNSITYLCILTACGHAGLLEEGQCIFKSMVVEPTSEHRACMVHLLAGGGSFKEAEEFIRRAPVSHMPLLWQTFLTACKNHSELESGLHIAEMMVDTRMEDPSTLVLLSNIFAVAGRWEDVRRVREIMKKRGIKKQPGCSWIKAHNQG